MSQTSNHQAESDVSMLWQQLTEHLDAWIAAWQGASEPPALDAFLPKDPGSLRRLTLIEAIKVDLEYRWQGLRWPKSIEQYQCEFPELSAEGDVPCDIIYEEYHVRKQQGEPVTAQEYCKRFPTRAEELRRLFQLESPEQSATLIPTEPMPVFEPGQRVDDFDLLSSLGKGAFATVFLARQCSMQRLVALKVSRDRGFEPQTLAQLEHPHIVRVFDQRQLAEQKIRLLYMQYVPGGTLQGVVEYARQVPVSLRSGATLLEAIDRALARNGEQPPLDSMTRYRLRKASWSQAVCWLGARLAGALDYAHRRGVLHRDVKPANVLIGADGHPKLADFNISFSKLDGATPAAYFGGSLAYMSPEQLEACDPSHARQPEELDARSDIYSLGVLLWELLTLHRPFPEKGLPQDWSQALEKMTRLRRAGLSREARERISAEGPRIVVEVLAKCLEPDVENRQASAADLARELDLCLQPRAHALLHGSRSWRSMFKRHPVLSTVLFGVLPNVALSGLNVTYNWEEIINRLSPEDKQVFLLQIVTINSIAYAIGLGYVCSTRAGVFGSLFRLARGASLAVAPSLTSVRRCLTLGLATAGITALLWAISGFIFPAWMQFNAGATSTLSAEHYRHFIASNLLCGMIAATQSYYVVTFFSVRYCYPWLLKARPAEADELSLLADVARRGRIFLGLTVSVPFVALSALVLINFDKSSIGALGGLGLFGCALAFGLYLTTQADLAALASAMNPSGDAFAGGDSLDSFLTGSRH